MMSDYLITQNALALFSRNGTKLLTYGDSLRTDVRTGLLHKVIRHHGRPDRKGDHT